MIPVNSCVSKSSSFNGLPVSTEAAQKTFTMLGDDFWKQIIDGEFHKYEKMVFDHGLHGREKEQGFFLSICKAFHLAKEHITDKELTVSLYLDLQKTACSHFQGQENNTEMLSSEAGCFKNENHKRTRAYFPAKQMLAFFDRIDLTNGDQNTLVEEFLNLRNAKGDEFTENCGNPSFYERMRKYYCITLLNSSTGKKFERFLNEKTAEVNKFLESLKADPVTGKAYPTFTLYSTSAVMTYAQPDGSNFTFEGVVNHIFSVFNRSIAEIDAQLNQPSLKNDNVHDLTDQKLTLIADLYQKLEWLHPFPDGQGRTDLILLGMLLSKHGFCPTILMYPYASSFSTLTEWASYLKEGMKEWQQTAEKIQSLKV